MAPLIHLENVCRYYSSGPTTVRALDDVSLTIEHGEFVAIMGQSGSGKSTMMNILGCLDRPTDGKYEILGKDATRLPNDELARLRRETFGFVFQRYNLLATATAAENVEIPAIYAGRDPEFRRERAQELLTRLGLGERGHHKPNELSGGQQQRVSIARALMNDPPVILADEPTGALDTASGQEVMALLKQLHAEGRTIILITHDPEVAAHAHRRIDLKDGKIIEDTGRNDEARAADTALESVKSGGLLSQIGESVKTAFRSLRANLFRTALTLLGVIIGVAAVVTMLAIGEGSRAAVVERIETMGSDLLYVRPGAPGTRMRGSSNASLTYEDAMALNEVDNVMAAVPERGSRETVRSGTTDVSTQITGTSEAYPEARNWDLADGVFFTAADEESYAAVAVIGQTVRENLFPETNPIGEFILIGGAPFEVIGTLSARGATTWGQDQDDVVLVPITTGFMRLFGGNFISSITVRADVDEIIGQTEEDVKNFLIQRHGGQEDFQIFNTASLLETVEDTQRTFTILLGSIAAVSLIVGGIGVMNIMLVSVSERTREIGVRMATGARRSDIMIQFNTEALVVGCLGGLLGVVIGFLCANSMGSFGMDIKITPQPAVLAFSCAVATGLVFGYLPARKASRMDPVAALSTE